MKTEKAWNGFYFVGGDADDDKNQTVYFNKCAECVNMAKTKYLNGLKIIILFLFVSDSYYFFYNHSGFCSFIFNLVQYVSSSCPLNLCNCKVLNNI